MRAVVQRVTEARVRVDERVAGEIGQGLLVLVGVGKDDGPEDVKYLAGKIATLRLFTGADGKDIDRSVLDVSGSVLVVSQFTLFGDARGQRRPSFIDAAPPDTARALYEDLVRELRAASVPVATLLLDSKKTF
jgi:D-tyrosyl-tRNA(Tyr) deacylase